VPILDMDPGQSPETAGTLSFYVQGSDPATGFQVTTAGVISAPGGVVAPVNFVGALAATDAFTARVTGDSAARFTIDSDGSLRWGGGSGASDCVLYRYAATGLAVDGALRLTNDQMLFGAGGDVNLYRGAADQLKTDDALVVAGSALTLSTAGGGVQVKEGSNATMGLSAAMTAGAVTVATTKVTANSRIFLTAQNTGGTPGALRISARTPATSFTITSTSGTDTSTVAWWIVEPAA
jgi:hypothetical protein